MNRFLLSTAVLLLTVFSLSAQELTDTTYRIDDVVVTGTRNRTDIRHLPMTISTINRQTLVAEYQNSILPSLNQQVPGLFSTARTVMGYGVSTGSTGGIKVRGIGSMANLLVLIDGLPQYAGLYGHPIADAYQTSWVEKVEVLRGPASVIYGSNAMGGVVNIVTRQMQEDGVRTHIRLQGGSYGTFEGDIFNRVRKGGFTSIVGYNYGRTDGHRENSSFDQNTGFIKLGYEFNPNWKVSGDVNLTHFNSDNPGTVSAPYFDNVMHVTRGVTAVSVENEYERTSGALRLYWNWGHHKINDGYQAGGSPKTAWYVHDDRMGGASIYQSVALFKGNRTTFGADYMHVGGHAWNQSMSDGSTTAEIIDRDIDEIAGYIDFRQNITTWLTFDAGARLDHHSTTGMELIPQAGLSFLLPRNAQVKAMVSKGFRNPTIRELYMYKPANQDLNPESMMNYELSFRQTLLRGRLSYGLNVFYLDAKDLIQTAMVDGKPLNINTGATQNSGFEVEAAYRMNSHWAFNSNYSFLHMTNPQLAAPEHKAFLGADYTLGKFKLNAGVQYIAGLYTAVGQNPQKESYCLVNLTADYALLKWLRIFVKGENLLGQEYETVAGFPMPKATFMGGAAISF